MKFSSKCHLVTTIFYLGYIIVYFIDTIAYFSDCVVVTDEMTKVGTSRRISPSTYNQVLGEWGRGSSEARKKFLSRPGVAESEIY